MSDNSEYSLRAPFVHSVNWKVRKLRDICSKIGSGATPTGGQANYLPSRENWALVRSQNVFDRRFDETGLAYITEEQAATLGGVVLQPEDVLLNITGDGVTFARSCQIPDSALPAVVNQHVSIIRPKSDLLSPGFLLAYLTHPETKHYIEGFNAGGSRRAITKGHIEAFNIPLPPLQMQQDIARILGTLDDKIELNRRTNETLEAMARAIFKSWFVDFDPVRAKASGEPPESICHRLGLTPELLALFPDSFQESELGNIPVGWAVAPVGKLAEIVGGGTPSTKEEAFWNDGLHYWATPKDLSKLATPVLLSSERKITDRGLAQIGSGLLPRGTVLLSSRAPIGYRAIAEVPIAINQGFIAMQPKQAVSRLFLLYWAEWAHQEIVSRANGSTFLEISKGSFRPIPVVTPSVGVFAAFDQLLGPIYERMVCNERETIALTEQRDTLLPQLLSGEICVPVEEIIS